MKKWIVSMAFLLAAPPAAWAVCGVDEVCVTIPAGSSAGTIAGLVGQNWDLPDFACEVTQTDVLEVTATKGTRKIKFVVLNTTTPAPHSFVLRFAIPLAPNGSPPIDVYLNYDNGGEFQLRDGTHVQQDITFVVSSPLPTASAAFPALDGLRGALLGGLLLASGLAYVVFRRL